MLYKVIKPLVPGTLASGTKYIGPPGKRDVIDPIISFDSFPDQDIYTVNPIYFVSERFKMNYLESPLTGIINFVRLKTEIAKEHFGEFDKKKPIGNYFRLILSDEDQDADFFQDRTKLLVSRNAIKFLSTMKIDHVTYKTYDPNWHAKLLDKDRKETAKNAKKQNGWIKRLFG